MKYYVIAGEASGDLHASNLMYALKKEDPDAEFRCWGGDLMEAAGGEIIKHYRDLAFMGFVEVAQNIRTILNNITFCKQDILDWQPDAVILVDYPGFNLRISKWAKKQGITNLYYISPQIWAWNSRRVHGIKASVDRMYVILPFEDAFYAKYDYEVDFVGHPLLDVIDKIAPTPDFLTENGLDERPIVALLPGSRKQEISKMLEGMLSVVNYFPDKQFVVAGAPSIDASFYQQLLKENEVARHVKIISGQTYQLLSHATAALVTSGTATLETALFEVPEIVCYKGSTISYHIARRLINVDYISLVNLIVDRPLVKELIQDEFNTEQLRRELGTLFDVKERQRLQDGYQELKAALGNSGASAKAAASMVSYLRNTVKA